MRATEHVLSIVRSQPELHAEKGPGDMPNLSFDDAIIHNAPFDTGFLNAELARVGPGEPVRIETCCTVTDTLVLARRLHPGQRNSLDALCTRYRIDNSHREKHGALLDAEIQADVYLAMTGGQATLSLDGATDAGARRDRYPGRRPVARVAPLRVVAATEANVAQESATVPD